MNTLAISRPSLALTAATAADLMSPNPVSLRADANIREAIALFTGRNVGAVPVINSAGRPIGVLSQTDILLHDRESVRRARMVDETGWDEVPASTHHEGFSVEVMDPTLVRDLMTPVVFAVGLQTPAEKVVEQLLALKIHHLFVTDKDESLVGVISALDVMRHLRPAD
jgi:CBS-domain-containing membrane protein